MSIYYTGVGSRKTPPNIVEMMHDIAIYKQREGFTLRSGGADGADKAFESGAGKLKTIFYANDATKEAMEIAAMFHPAWNRCSEYAKKLHGRNSFQVLGNRLDVPSKCLICWTPDGCKSHSTRSIKTGGTGTAISIAEHFNVPVYNLANKEDYDYWYSWLVEHSHSLKMALPHKLKYIYTAHYRYSGPDRTDITLKGQDPDGKYFAPTKEMVHGVLYHGMPEQEYVDRYVEILKAAPLGAWNWLLSEETRTFVCFCRQGNFCHRNILANYMLDILGNRIKYMGWRD